MKGIVHSFKRPYAITHDVEFVPPYKMTEEAIRLDERDIISGTPKRIGADATTHRHDDAVEAPMAD